MDYIYQIADTVFCVQNGVRLLCDDDGLAFQCLDSVERKTDFSIKPLFENECYYGVEVGSAEEFTYVLKNNNSYLLADSNWTKGALCGEDSFYNDSLLLMFLCSHLLSHKTLFLHSSLVDYNGRGIMFVGPSGIGKTTQAELWNKYQNADILNGDLAIVRKIGDGFYGYGSPWHGSSPYFLNRKVKIKAVVALSQSENNSIKKLSDFNLLRSVADQVFYPYWYREAMDLCFATLDEFLTELPVYNLSCRADSDAVMLLKNELNL